MDRDLFMTSRRVQAAAGALVLALLLAGWTGARAMRIDPVVPAAPPTFATAAALARAGMVVPADVGAVVGHNMFSPERKAPARRYRLSGYTEEAPRVQPPQPIVLGTAVSAGGRSFAMCKVGDGAPQVLYVGDIIGGFTVKSIERGLVVFTTPAGERLEIKASIP